MREEHKLHSAGKRPRGRVVLVDAAVTCRLVGRDCKSVEMTAVALRGNDKDEKDEDEGESKEIGEVV